jgi:glycosyltransferase involved in cell wall biosynthesis
MQKCKYKFLLIIGEDHSSDNTREICEKFQNKYPEKILLIKNKDNEGLIKNYVNLFSRCTAKYVAILESDDYWCDFQKLQNQIELMEKNDSIGLVHSKSATIYEDGRKKINYHLKQAKYNNLDLFSLILKGRYGIVPLTACFRTELLNKIDFKFCIEKNLKTIDAFLWPEFSIHTKFYFLNEVTGCYRYLSSSESNSNDYEKILKFNKSLINISTYYLNKYPLARLSENEVISQHSYSMVNTSLKFKKFTDAYRFKQQIQLNSIKNVWVWIIASLPLLYPLYSLNLLIIKNASILKQIIYKINIRTSLFTVYFSKSVKMF